MKKRVYNFAAGPAQLPEEVLKKAKKEMMNYKGTGMSVMEMSHRSKMYQDIIDSARNDLKELLNVPDNYKILFMQGGATTQFACVPMHLLKKCGGYINSGHWTKKAIVEAKMHGDVKVLASSEEDKFTYIPDCSDLDVSDVDYVYYCDNNTIYGTKFKEVPDAKGKILVADMSSCFLSEKIDVSKYGIIFAGAQKNVGPAGVTIVIIRDDLLDDCKPYTPTLLRYKVMADSDSLYNTPPCYNIYICGLVFKWLKKMGGIDAIEERNKEKAKIIYDYLDSTDFYQTSVRKDSRSLMNVVFRTKSDELDKKFVEDAAKAGFVNLKGHKQVGGLRASIYNACDVNQVKKLVEFMKKFEVKYVQD